MLTLDQNTIQRFKTYLEDRECSRATIQKYLHDIHLLAEFCAGKVEEKGQLIAFKEHLQNCYAPTSVNSMLAAINRFLDFSNRQDWKLRFVKVQRATFASRETELCREEYERLVSAARRKGDERLAMLIQTICATGIRVSEVRAITVESLHRGRAELRSKGKIRLILIPRQLCKALLRYCREQSIKRGQVFVTRTGRPLDRSNIWKMMKRLAAAAKIKAKKVFPHNLRHLFARTYYKRYKDIVRLADILGHSSIETTRIYTIKDPQEQQRQVDQLCLLC